MLSQTRGCHLLQFTMTQMWMSFRKTWTTRSDATSSGGESLISTASNLQPSAGISRTTLKHAQTWVVPLFEICGVCLKGNQQDNGAILGPTFEKGQTHTFKHGVTGSEAFGRSQCAWLPGHALVAAHIDPEALGTQAAWGVSVRLDPPKLAL